MSKKCFTLAEGVIRHCERSVAIQNKGISPSPQPSPQRVEGEITLNPCLRKCAFTLAEGATHVDMSNGYRKAAFTLAEVLIVIGVIGIVAALTIPTLMKAIRDKVNSNHMTVIEKRLLQGLNQLNTLDNGLSVPYDTTEDFVRALSKHLKITTICGKDELTKCLPYDKIYYDNNGELKSVNVADLKTASGLQIKEDGFVDTAGFVMADGTPFIISYNQKCHELETNYSLADPDKPMKKISPCIVGVYDLNGARTPNKFGTKVVDGQTVSTSDIISLNGGKIGSSCVMEFQLGGKTTCVTTKAEIASTPISQADCDTYKSAMGTEYCNQSSGGHGFSAQDIWSNAALACYKKGQRLPTDDELTEIAKLLYDDNSIVTGTSKWGISWKNRSITTELGIEDNVSSFSLWSSSEEGASYAGGRWFVSNSGTLRTIAGRGVSDYLFICVEK